MADRVGEQLGNYRLTRLLGEGASAQVYLGEHMHLGTPAAIKVLLTNLSSADLEKFRREARLMARLRHPHITRVLEFGVEDSTPFLVMEYAPNGSLRQRHPKGTQLSPGFILPYVRQTAEALQYLHNQRLIHRDVKPENVLLGPENEVLVNDFGIAVVTQSMRAEETPGLAGTALYIAPEQIQHQPVPASDQYALGVMAYEWLAGRWPFEGTYLEVVSKHILTQPLPLRQHVPTLSPLVERVVLIALAKDPAQRFSSVQAFALAFEQACQAAATARPSHPYISAPRVQTPSGQLPAARQARYLPNDPMATQVARPAAPTSPQPAPAPRPKARRPTILLAAILAVMLLAIVGGAAYILSRPQPVITLDKTAPGHYASGQTPAGASGTMFCISGRKFSANAAVTFLLDGQPIPDTNTAQTGADGAIVNNNQNNLCQNNQDFALSVTPRWGLGIYTLTARDNNGYTTDSGVTIMMVTPGMAGTPGPHSAPTDTAEFTLTVHIDRIDAVTSQDLGSFDDTLMVKGDVSPQVVCESDDDGQPHTRSGVLSNGTPYDETYSETCSGSYQGGVLTYIETVTSDQYVLHESQANVTCVETTPYVNEKLVGSFSDATHITGGMYTADQINATCTLNGQTVTNNNDPEEGPWTGIIA